MKRYLEKVGESCFALGLLFGEVHREREVVDEATIYVEDQGLAEARDEHVAESLVLVPRAHALGERDPEQRVTVQNLRQPVEQRRYLRLTQNRRQIFCQGLFVILK